MNWRKTFRQKAEHPNHLWAMVAVILGAGLMLGAIVQFLPQQFVVDENSINDAITMGWESGVTGDDGAGIERILAQDVPFDFQLVALAHVNFAEDAAAAAILSSVSPNDEAQKDEYASNEQASKNEALSKAAIARQLMMSVALGSPVPGLARMAGEQPTPRHVHQAMGAFYLKIGSHSLAAKHFEIEGRFPDAQIARQFALDTYGAANDSDSLMRLSLHPEYESLITPSELLVIAESKRDWNAITWTIPRLMAERFKQGFATGLALLAGLGWFVLAIQMGQTRSTVNVRVWLCTLALVMGGLSVWATHLINIWQELDWGITESDGLVEGIKFYVLGVGLREELAKMLLLLPLMPIIVRRRSPIEALIVSACVGLGFAIVENMGYFARSGSTDSMGRFLTANFFHMTMTGLIGLAIARAFWKTHDISHALLTFLLVMLAHGFYDATIAIPELAQFSIAGMIIFILSSYAFFHEVRTSYSQSQDTISLTASFLFIVSMLTSVTFVYVSWRFGFTASVTMLSVDVIGLGIMVYMYLREMPNSLIT